MEMGFKWDFAYEILPQMLWATLNTIIIYQATLFLSRLIFFNLEKVIH